MLSDLILMLQTHESLEAHSQTILPKKCVLCWENCGSELGINHESADDVGYLSVSVCLDLQSCPEEKS